MQYELVTHDDLEGLRQALNLLERVIERAPIKLYFYGLSNHTGVLAKANDALEEEAEVGEDEPAKPSTQVSQVAVCIQLSGDTIHYLIGSGLILRRESFAYIGGGDGVRTSDLGYSHKQTRVTDEDFTEMALSESDNWLDDFLEKHGKKGAGTTEPVSRSEPATSEGEESEPEPEPNPIDEFLNH